MVWGVGTEQWDYRTASNPWSCSWATCEAIHTSDNEGMWEMMSVQNWIYWCAKANWEYRGAQVVANDRGRVKPTDWQPWLGRLSEEMST